MTRAAKSSGTPTKGAALEVAQLSKRFDGALALDRVSLSVARGEVHGLLGSNGSGKSTLIKILAGFYEAEPGAEISLYGDPLPLPVSAALAREKGLAFVHQQLGLIATLTVTENLFLNRLATETSWALNWGRLHAEASDTFARFGLALDPRAQVAQLTPVQQALLAIVRAYEALGQGATVPAERPGVLVLDEPTPFLPKAGVEQLFRLIRQCTQSGASVIFVSHDVDEVREITDRASILRDGVLIDTVETAQTSHAGFVRSIIGRNLDTYSRQAKRQSRRETAVTVTELTGPGLGPLNFEMTRGEILGLTGLIGSGCDAVPAMLYGARAGSSGTLALDGEERAIATITPQEALAWGLAYLPADRLGAAGVGTLPVGDNAALPVYAELTSGPFLTTGSINNHTRSLAGRAGVTPNLPELPLAALSGGNAQKALLAKWLQTEPRLLLLDEPTQGVDVGARQRLWDALNSAALTGTAVLIGSTDYDQLAQLCHRVLIFARGQILTELQGATLTKERIAEHCYRAMAA